MPSTTQPAAILTADDVLAPFIWVFFAAFFISLLATPVMRWLARKNNIVDWPDMKRKSHVQPIAYLGGVAIFLGWLAGVAVSIGLEPKLPTGIYLNPQMPLGILFGAAVIVLVGLMDDVYGISARVKVGGQLLAAAALANEKLGTGQTVGYELVAQTLKVIGDQANLPMLSHPNPTLCYILGALAIAVFVVGGCNAVNLMDGLDGLASGIVAIANLGFLFIAVFVARAISSQSELDYAAATRIVLCLALLGGILGFLPYNFNPASIFMGDTGSLLLGYLSISIILMFAHSAAKGPMFITAGLIIFALPITDTALAIVRRKIRGQPISSADNQHLHHQFLRIFKSRNLSHNTSVKLAVLSLYAIAAGFAVFGSLLVYLRWRYVVAVALVVFGFILVAAYKAGQRFALQIQTQDAAKVPPTMAPPPEASSIASESPDVSVPDPSSSTKSS